MTRRRKTMSFRYFVPFMSAACISLAGFSSSEGYAQVPPSCFVSRQTSVFQLNGCLFRFAGTNSYYQMIHRRGTDRPGVDEVLDEMAARRMTVLRTWAFQDDAGRADCLQCAPTRQLTSLERPANFINEATFRGLDELLVQASRRGIRVILAFTNNWDDFGGMRRYSLWRFGPQGVNHDAFYSDPVIRSWFKEYISLLVNRVNYVNGRRYGDDPTILAWELANEPRCSDSSCRTDGWIDSWILDISCFIKSIDPNHMVTTGIEGFYGPIRAERNSDSWMAQEGTDFIDNHSGPCVDFATVHVWPANWGWDPIAQPVAALARAHTYTVQRLIDGRDVLGMPVVIEEFGVPRDDGSRCPDPGDMGSTNIRDQFYELFYGLCEQFASPDGSCVGALNWKVYDGPSCSYDDGNGVFLPEDATTDEVMTEHAKMFGTCSGGQGNGETTCVCVECDAVIGACCDLFSGRCASYVPESACSGTHQAWNGGAPCVDVVCDAVTGACCDLISGTCAEDVPIGACSGMQQAWTEGAACVDVECDAVTGACCDRDPFGGACTDHVTRAECDCPTCEWVKLGSCSQLDCPHTSIPTVSEWGLIVLSLLLLAGAKLAFRRSETRPLVITRGTDHSGY